MVRCLTSGRGSPSDSFPCSRGRQRGADEALLPLFGIVRRCRILACSAAPSPLVFVQFVNSALATGRLYQLRPSKASNVNAPLQLLTGGANFIRLLLLVCGGLVLDLLYHWPQLFQRGGVLGAELLRGATRIGMLHGVEHCPR